MEWHSGVVIGSVLPSVYTFYYNAALQRDRNERSVSHSEHVTTLLTLFLGECLALKRRRLALGGALPHVLLEGLARGDGALLPQGVVLGGHGCGVLGVGLG